MLALTPPLGWNSWNAWGNTVTAEKVRVSADGMVTSGLARQGYTYINIDDVWEGGNEPNPATGRGRNVAAGRDAKGEILTNANFPDMKGLVDSHPRPRPQGRHLLVAGADDVPGTRRDVSAREQDVRTWAKWGIRLPQVRLVLVSAGLRQPRRSSSGRRRIGFCARRSTTSIAT